MTTTGLRRLWLPTGLALSLAACASPTTPSVSVAAARPLGPDPDASISYYSQPIVLPSTQTSFMPTTDLRSGTTYYWRVHASDATHSVNGPFSVVQSFTTANPDDGVSRYTLTLHLVSAEDCSAWGPPSLRDVSFDDGLVVTGDHLRYRVEENFTTAVALNLVRDADVISGTLEGNLDWPGHRFLGVLFKLNVVAGTRDDESGRFTGTAVGPLAEAGIPGYNACGRATVAFTLTPH